jgi:hypothetical protein
MRRREKMAEAGSVEGTIVSQHQDLSADADTNRLKLHSFTLECRFDLLAMSVV